MILRSDFQKGLSKLIEHGEKTTDELRTLSKKLESLRTENITSLSPEALKQIQSLRELPENAIKTIREHRILAALRFEMMDERFHSVQKAHEKTFAWILNDDTSSTDDQDRSDKQSF